MRGRPTDANLKVHDRLLSLGQVLDRGTEVKRSWFIAIKQDDLQNDRYQQPCKQRNNLCSNERKSCVRPLASLSLIILSIIAIVLSFLFYEQ